MLVKTIITAVAIKYGELYFNAPFEAHAQNAIIPILLFTLFNITKWGNRSKELEMTSSSTSSMHPCKERRKR